MEPQVYSKRLDCRSGNPTDGLGVRSGVVGGVDTHADVHVAAALDQN
jgi:hypothetical protein